MFATAQPRIRTFALLITTLAVLAAGLLTARPADAATRTFPYPNNFPATPTASVVHEFDCIWNGDKCRAFKRWRSAFWSIKHGNYYALDAVLSIASTYRPSIAWHASNNRNDYCSILLRRQTAHLWLDLRNDKKLAQGMEKLFTGGRYGKLYWTTAKITLQRGVSLVSAHKAKIHAESILAALRTRGCA